MKKLFATVFAVIMLIGLAVMVSGAGLTASVSNGVGEIGTDENPSAVTLTITLSDTVTVQTGSVSIAYDKNVFELIGGQWYGDTAAVGTFNVASGVGSFAFSEDTKISGSTVFLATFRIKSGVQLGTYSVSMNIELRDAANQIALTNLPGSITVKCRQDFTGTDLTHLADPASCTEPAKYYYTCTCCGAAGTETFAFGEPLGHTGGTATCEQKAVCTRCQQEYGQPLGHTGGTATCTEKAVCTRCQQEYGELLGHIGGTATCEEKAVCTRCQQEYGEALGHTGGTATCTQQAECSRCGQPYGQKLAHTYDREVVRQEYLASVADCLNPAYYHKSCVCGEKGTELFANGTALGHTGGTATCTEAAICTRCNQPYGEKLPHTFNQEVATAAHEKAPADCLNPATYYISCTCGANGTETFTVGEALGHTGGTATCSQQAVCTRCNQGYGELKEHTYDKRAATTAYWRTTATCTEKATYYYSCACGAVGSEFFEIGIPLGHTGGTATCAEAAICTRCNQPYGEKLPHVFNQKITSDEHKKYDVGCLTAETYYISCACGANSEETFTVGTALGHTGGTATCAEAAICTRCNQPYGEKLPHTFDQKVTTEAHVKTPADCLNAAVYYKSCTCGANGKETFTVGTALGHTEVVDAAVEPTCTTPGKTEGKHCSVCGLILVAQKDIDAPGHQFGPWNTHQDATCTKPGEDIRTCINCNEVETQKTEIGDHNWKDATCSDPKTCIDCGKTEGKPLDHVFGEWSDSDNDGEQERVCTSCGEEEKETGNGAVAKCAICGKRNICLSFIPLCWLCLLILLLIILALVAVIVWIIIKKRKEQKEEPDEER